MFKKFSIYKYEFISTFFIIALGVILHFTYNFFNNNVIVGIISPVNESVWEHLKLLYVPIIFMACLSGFCVEFKHDNYWCSKARGILYAMLFTIIFFYTYSGILGYNIGIINIIIFVLSVIVSQYSVIQNLRSNKVCNKNKAIIFLIILGILFVVFTFNPPKIALFIDPITGRNGI